jgi:hypothetical protein
LGSELVIANVPQVSEKFCVVDAPTLSVTFTVKLNAPVAVGVPPITPPPLKLNPAGNDPDVIVQFSAPVPPVAASVFE